MHTEGKDDFREVAWRGGVLWGPWKSVSPATHGGIFAFLCFSKREDRNPSTWPGFLIVCLLKILPEVFRFFLLFRKEKAIWSKWFY